MKTIRNFKNRISDVSLLILFLAMSISVTACDPTLDPFTFDLAEAGSKPDLNPPKAIFRVISSRDYLTYNFSNTSTSSTDWIWDYGDGKTSTGKDGMNTFPGEGTFTVTLTAKDKAGASSTFSTQIIVVKPLVPVVIPPTILEADFDKGNDSRAAWNPTFRRLATSLLQITTSAGYFEGTAGARLPDTDFGRFGYQELDFTTPNTTYTLRYKYRFRDRVPARTGVLNMTILKPITVWDLNLIASNTVATVIHTETVETSAALVEGFITFNSGTNPRLAILFYHDFDEVYVDSFTIVVNQ